MPKQFKPTDSKSLFVGREREFERIDRLLENRQAEWLIWVNSPGTIDGVDLQGHTIILAQKG